jgi:hypothetical protein
MQAPSPQVNCPCEQFPGILTVDAEQVTNTLVTISLTAAVKNTLINTGFTFQLHYKPNANMLSVIKKSTMNFQTHGVSFIAVLRTAAAMGCHDRCRLSMQYSLPSTE